MRSPRFAHVVVLAGLVVALALAGALQAAAISDIYVSTAGNDTSGNGSLGNPYRTISKGMSMAVSGIAVRVAAGTYSEDVTLTSGVRQAAGRV